MNICVVGGAGYVGLVTGVALAELGNNVVNVDIDMARIDRLRKGESPFYEKGMEALLESNIEAGRIRFCTELPPVVAASEVIFVAVGTPSLEDGQADLSYVIRVAEELLSCMNEYKVIVVKSTVPVGTVELMRSILCREKVEGRDFDIVSNPEFLQEGNGLRDFFDPDRIVLGSHSEKAVEIVRQLHYPIIHRQVGATCSKNQDGGTQHRGRSKERESVPVVETTIASAQMIKYASNAFLAARISVINEIAALCEQVGADIKEVSEGMGYDNRIGHAYLSAGLGFGGPCLEKDLRALIKIAEASGQEVHTLKAVLERNEKQIGDIIFKLKECLNYLLYQRIITVFGLAFKPGTNDVRGSLALKVIDRLIKEGAVVRAYDPLAGPEAAGVITEVEYSADPYSALRQADALLVLTEWPEFAGLDYKRIHDIMASPVIIDGRNLLDANYIKSLNFTYRAFGTS